MNTPFYGLYALLQLALTLLAYSLFQSKNGCDEAMLEWSRSLIPGDAPFVSQDLDARARTICDVAGAKGRAVGGAFEGK